MAANKFATMLHRNTHRIAVVLVYTLLEWTLILLLLLNSLFAYLIAKFAAFFGLKPPCPWCSRLDHLLEPGGDPTAYRNLLCESHAAEISRLGYCSSHRRLAESGSMCEDCSSSRPRHTGADRHVAFFSFVGDRVTGIDNGGKDATCSCCGASVNGRLFSPYLIFKPSWGVLDYPHKGNLIKAKGDEGDDCFGFVENGYSDPSKSDYPTDHDEEGIDDEERVAENQMLSDASADKCLMEGMESGECLDCEMGSVKSEEDSVLPSCNDTDESLAQFCCEKDRSFEFVAESHEICSEGDRLVPVGLIDSVTLNDQCLSRDEDLDEETLDAELQFPVVLPSLIDMGSDLDEETERVKIDGIDDSCKSTRSGNIENIAEKRCPLLFLDEDSDGDLVAEVFPPAVTTQTIGRLSICEAPIEVAQKDSDETPASEEVSNVIFVEGKSDDFMEKVICEEEMVDHPQGRETIASSGCIQEDPFPDNQNGTCISDGAASSACIQEDPFPDSHNSTCISDSPPCEEDTIADEEQDPGQPKEFTIDSGDCCIALKPVVEMDLDEKINHEVNQNLNVLIEMELEQKSNHEENQNSTTLSELNDAEEDRPPETPTYMEGINNLHKRLLFERKESGTESLDGSIISDIEGGEVLTLDRLKSALRAEHKALSALYAELEEERSASAVAANQTMAMITRLQEEKAAVQMEALQYQRMMEEQSEYDQEALQLLNELMVKREKENQELEKELELYRKKVLLYEAKEKRMKKKEKKANMSNGMSSASSSADDSDDRSADLNEGEESFYNLQEGSNNTPTNEILSLGMELESAKQLSILDESLAEFEEERLSILEELKVLEEKLFTLGCEDGLFEDVKPIGSFTEENGDIIDEHFEFHGQGVNGVTDGLTEEVGVNGKHDACRNVTSKGKRLLPLFDAISMENEEELTEEMLSAIVSQDSAHRLSLDKKRLAIEEEVDHVHERLQALEADREFLKHCISSLKKGDRGLDLLQEILQHLRDLRSVELRVRSTSDGLS
ncbi:hypothetical protein ACLOJK_007400 [Asimina triloba]